jgi:uncharacterized phage protein (TIGR02220 family)
MPQRFLSIKNLEKYQTNKNSNPPWFKLHRIMFGDPEFIKLTPSQRFLYIGLIHLAVESGNRIYNDSTFIGQRLYIKSTEVDLKPLYRAGFLYTTNLSRVLSETEESREREEEICPVVNGRNYKEEAKTVLGFLNEKTGKNYREVDSNLDFIIARLKSGVDIQTCKTLIARKVRDWTPKPEMVPYLRPETLFNKTKFETYLAEVTQ